MEIDRLQQKGKGEESKGKGKDKGKGKSNDEKGKGKGKGGKQSGSGNKGDQKLQRQGDQRKGQRRSRCVLDVRPARRHG